MQNPPTGEQQVLLQQRAAREFARHAKQEGFETETKCWKEDCVYIPLAHVILLDGACFYTCRADAVELLEGVPEPPLVLGTGAEKAN